MLEELAQFLRQFRMAGQQLIPIGYVARTAKLILVGHGIKQRLLHQVRGIDPLVQPGFDLIARTVHSGFAQTVITAALNIDDIGCSIMR